MNIGQLAYQELFERACPKEIHIEYSGRYKEYNAKITETNTKITVSMSKTWKEISADIKKGLIQELIVKLRKTKQHTINMDLYGNFIKSLPKHTIKTHNHPILQKSFDRVNEQHFAGQLERPNLKLGNGINQLGKYEYATDTVSITKNLLENEELLDYVMYHELLHKKHQFKSRAGRHSHHTAAFRKDEKSYPNAEKLEAELAKHVKKSKRKLTTFKWLKLR